MVIEIGDKVIEGKIMEKQKAQEKYDDAIASGNTATLLNESEEKESLTLSMGNILPGQIITVHVCLLFVLKIEAGAYCLKVPAMFFPGYDVGCSGPSYEYLVDIDILS